MLEAMYGHDCRVRPHPPETTDNYAPTHINPTQKWIGGTYTVIYHASAYGTANGTCIPGNLPSCAYQFRLGLIKANVIAWDLEKLENKG